MARKALVKVKKKIAESQRKGLAKKGDKITSGMERGETTPEQGEVKTLNRAMLSRFISHYALASGAEIKKALADPKIPMIEKITCSILQAAMTKADPYRLEFILARSIGKVKDEVDLTVKDKYAHLSTEQLLALRNQLAEKNIETLRLMVNAASKFRSDAESKTEKTPNDAPGDPSLDPRRDRATQGD